MSAPKDTGPEVTRDDPMIAAEWALGLLEGEELLAARGKAATDPDFAWRKQWWDDWFAPLTDGMAGAEPGDQVWDGIAARIAAQQATADVAAASPEAPAVNVVALEARVRRWQWVAGISSMAAAVALALFLFAAPRAWKRFAAQLHALPDRHLRWLGGFVTAGGILALWLARRPALAADEALRGAIQGVITANGLTILHQPIHALETGLPVGAECLARFADSSVRGPDQWFNEAAQVGLGIELEMLAFRNALATAAHVPSTCYLSINASPEAVLSGQVLAKEEVREVTPFSKISLKISAFSILTI